MFLAGLSLLDVLFLERSRGNIRTELVISKRMIRLVESGIKEMKSKRS